MFMCGHAQGLNYQYVKHVYCITVVYGTQNLSETIYVAEVLLNISTESSQNAPKVPPHPPKPGDKGVMQVLYRWLNNLVCNTLCWLIALTVPVLN